MSGESHKEIAVIIMTGYGTTDKAVQAMHLGAFDFISKTLQAGSHCNDCKQGFIVDETEERKYSSQRSTQGPV